MRSMLSTRRIPFAPQSSTSAPAQPMGWWTLALILVAAIGCGRPAEVTGRVTLDGEPVPAGVVTFTPVGGGPSGYGAITPDGRYSVQTGSKNGVPPGDYRVTVAANALPSEGVPTGPGQLSDGIAPLITPARYADPAETPLRATLVSGTQELPLDLTSQ